MANPISLLGPPLGNGLQRALEPSLPQIEVNCLLIQEINRLREAVNHLQTLLNRQVHLMAAINPLNNTALQTRARPVSIDSIGQLYQMLASVEPETQPVYSLSSPLTLVMHQQSTVATHWPANYQYNVDFMPPPAQVLYEQRAHVEPAQRNRSVSSDTDSGYGTPVEQQYQGQYRM